MLLSSQLFASYFWTIKIDVLKVNTFRRIGGFPNDLTYGIEAAELYELAMGEGVELPVAPLWTATYDGPNVIVNRNMIISTVF